MWCTHLTRDLRETHYESRNLSSKMVAVRNLEYQQGHMHNVKLMVDSKICDI